jgi:glycine cleavage system regulatory protein
MADKDHLILTAIGPDQVGLVQRISEFISRHACNIEDSKMAVFCGEFAVIMLITGEADNLANIQPQDPGCFSPLPAHRLLHGSPWHCLPN